MSHSIQAFQGAAYLLAGWALAAPVHAQEEAAPEPFEVGLQSSEVAAIEAMDTAGDSISKAFNGQGRFLCPNRDQEEFNYATSDTHGSDFCSAGPEGVFSQAERIECSRGADVSSHTPNSSESGAQMLLDFAAQAANIKDWLLTQPAPRYVPVLLGHNDVCGGTVWKFNLSCPRGRDQDPRNYCRTTPAAFERELRKGLDVLITVPDTKVGVASMVRVSQLCNHSGKQNCQTFTNCQSLWSTVAYTGWIFGQANGICGSLTVNCSNARRVDAYRTAKAYRDVTARVAEEYALLGPGSASRNVTVGGQTVGGAVKAPGVVVRHSDAPWRYRFAAGQLNCCDCFHPSPSGQNVASRILFEGLSCTDAEPCCADTGDALADARCAVTETGVFYDGFFH